MTQTTSTGKTPETLINKLCSLFNQFQEFIFPYVFQVLFLCSKFSKPGFSNT